MPLVKPEVETFAKINVIGVDLNKDIVKKHIKN